MRNHGFLKMAAAGAMAVAMMAAPGAAMAQGSDSVLKPADVQKLLPASVFYRGQSATTQLRNSAGVKLADGLYVLATLVDTSGYSTGVAAKYQAYFITEVPLKVGGHRRGRPRRADSERGRGCRAQAAPAAAGGGRRGRRRIPALRRTQVCDLRQIVVSDWRSQLS